MISKDMIERSYLRDLNHEDENVFDSLRVKYKTIPLPFIVRFDYESDESCEITFPLGGKVKLNSYYRLEQFVYTVTGDKM